MITPRKISSFEAFLLTFLFALAITLPGIKLIFCGEADTSSLEGRLPNPLPASPLRKLSRWRKPKTIQALEEYPGQFENYYNDHFGFRSALLHLGSLIKVKFPMISPNRDVAIGKDGWLFLKDGGVLHEPPVLAESDLRCWTLGLEHKQEWLARHGSQFLYVVAPNKESVYPEFLPQNDSRLRGRRQVDQLSQYASLRPNVHFLSLRESLIDAKGGERLYYRQDTHWNSWGAFIGYQAIVNRLGQWFPDLKARNRSEFPIVMEKKKGDLARMMGLPDFSSESEPALGAAFPPAAVTTEFWPNGIKQTKAVRPYTIEMPNASSGLRAVVLRDSFGTALLPYLSGHFSRITVIWQVDQKFEDQVADIVRKEKPDVLIEEHLERVLPERPPDPDTVFANAKD
jgi:alginate O-acetyltransferase complex protein AlgJ